MTAGPSTAGPAPAPPEQSLATTLRRVTGMVALAVAIAWAWHGTGFEVSRLGNSLTPLAEFLGRMTPPDLSVLEVAMKSTSETLQIAALGLGPVPGVLALAVHSIGMLAKFYADAFESARQGPIEALDSAGANWLQRIRYGVLTQVAPDLARDTLFRFELNLRESLVLGLVGAGGIGFYIQLYIRSFQYQRVATLTLVILLIVVLVEQGSVAIRRRLR